MSGQGEETWAAPGSTSASSDPPVDPAGGDPPAGGAAGDGGGRGRIVALELPADWAFVALDDTAEGAGAQLFLDDPESQMFVDGVAEIIAATGPRLLAADPELGAALASAPPPVLALERQPFDRGLEPTVQAFLDAYAGVGVTDAQRRDLTGAFGPIVAVENHDVDRVDYFFVGGGQTWKLAYVSATGEFEAELPGIDEIAMSFTATPVAAA